jgi:hypothetical protein
MTWAIATPLQHSNIRRWLAELAHVVAEATRRQPRPQPRPRSIAQREPFVEEAAMAREMLRL